MYVEANLQEGVFPIMQDFREVQLAHTEFV